MEFWSGILLVSSEDDLRQNANLQGKRFSDLSAEGNNFLASCEDGVFTLTDHESEVSHVSEQPFHRLSSGKGFTVAVRETGELYSWGTEGDSGQLGQGAHNRKIFVPLEVKYKVKATSLSCGESHCVALDADGKAHAWGENSDRQLNIYSKTKENMSIKNAMIEEMIFNPRLIPWSMKTPLQKVACGKSFTTVITKDGRVFSWGAGECGQLGTGRCTKKDLPTDVVFPSSSTIITDLACGNSHCLALTSTGDVYGWGLNQRGQLGLNDFKARHQPEALSSLQSILSTFQKLFANEHSSAAIDSAGQLWTWGSTSHGRLMHPTITNRNASPFSETVPSDVPFSAPPKSEDVHSIAVPSLVSLPGTQGLKFEHFAFSRTRAAVLVRTTLTDVSPKRGPKRGFSKLSIHGFGLSESSSILVKFASRVYSLYNPPRSVLGRLQDPFTIVCKPPKFSELGIYTVSVSLDGGERYLPETFDITVYKEVTVLQQLPPIVDLRSPVVESLLLRVQGSKALSNKPQTAAGREDGSGDSAINSHRSLHSHQSNHSNVNKGSSNQQQEVDNQGILVKASLFRVDEAKAQYATNPPSAPVAIKEFFFRGRIVSESLVPAMTGSTTAATPAVAGGTSRPLTADLSQTGTVKSMDSEFLLECRDLQLPFDSETVDGVYEMICSVSFNDQDFSVAVPHHHHQHHHIGQHSGAVDSSAGVAGGSVGTLCHAFRAVEATPCCLALRTLDVVRSEVAQQVEQLRQSRQQELDEYGGGAGGLTGSDSTASLPDGSIAAAASAEDVPMDVVFGQLRHLDRKISVRASSLLPTHKLPRGAHIKVRLDRCEVIPVDPSDSSATSGLQIEGPTLWSAVDALLVYVDGADAAHFNLSAAFLSALDVFLTSQGVDRNTQLVTLHWHFYLESTSQPQHAPASHAAGMFEQDAAANHSEHASAQLLLLSEDTLPMTLYPPAPLTAQPYSFRREPLTETGDLEAAMVSLSCNNLVLRPNTASVRLHCTDSKEVIVLDQRQLIISEVPAEEGQPAISSESATEEVSSDATAAGQTTSVKRFRVQFALPQYAVLAKKWPSSSSGSGEGAVSGPSTIHVSLSLDGQTIPAETFWTPLYFFSDLSKYTLQTAVPKGGFVAGAALSLQLTQERCAVTMPIAVQLRGADEEKAQTLVAQVSDNGSATLVGFALPDAATLATNPPVVQGKEKLYFVDVSGDGGVSFDRASAPLIPVK